MRGWRIPESKRELFKESIGTEISESELRKLDAKKTITVGDVVSLTARKNGMVPVLSIYDGFTERHETTGFADLVREQGLEEMVVVNPAGTITRELTDAIKQTQGKPRIIRVEGEEDLALMPCILYSPEGTEIIYGWPGKGMMRVTTDVASRDRVERLWESMEVIE